MDDPLGVGVPERAGDPGDERRRPPRRQGGLPHDGLEAAALEELHEVIGAAAREHARSERLHDPRVVEALEELDLALQAPDGLVPAPAREEDLERALSPRRQVLGAVDRAHASMAEELGDLPAVDDASHEVARSAGHVLRLAPC